MAESLSRRSTPPAFLALVLLSGCAGDPKPAPPSGASAAPVAGKPKYGHAIPLSRAHEYFRSAAAPDFWALAPYSVGQVDERSCSLASMTMVLNAARAARPLGAGDELVTQEALLERVGRWKPFVGTLGRGVTLDALPSLALEALASYGFKNARAEVVHAEDAAGRAAIRNALAENERSASDFIIANFDQGVLTGDEHVGHLAPVAAYDSTSRRVLILDPDRRWYEPYWVGEEDFMEALATRDSIAGRARGLLWISLDKTAAER